MNSDPTEAQFLHLVNYYKWYTPIRLLTHIYQSCDTEDNIIYKFCKDKSSIDDINS